MAKKQTFATCHPDLPNAARGYCKPCYRKWKHSEGLSKATCHPDRPLMARGLCSTCYQAWHRNNGTSKAKCHPDLSAYSKGLCRPCYRIAVTDLDAKAAHERARRAAWTDEQKAAERIRLDQLPNKTAAARKSHRRKMGIVDAHGDRKDGACEACVGNHVSLHLDHDHSTGAIRGWLCRQCNLALGMLRDDPTRIEQLHAYLKRFKS